MLGRITLRHLHLEYTNNPIIPNPIPDSLHHPWTSCFFNEVHIEQEGGSTIHDKLQIRFTRNDEGNYDPTSIKIAAEEYTSTFKYTQQARFCLGVAKVRLLDGQIEGRKCKAFDYISKRILTIQMYKIKTQDELKKVKSLSSTKNSLWLTDDRPAGDVSLYEEDCLFKIPKLGNATLQKFTDLGISKVGDLKHLPPDNVEDLKAIQIRSLASILSGANASIPGSSPYTTTDQWKETNP